MTPEGCPSWIKRSVVSIIGLKLWAVCQALAVIRSGRGSRSTCGLCWLSMLQCCGNSTLELITFSMIGRQYLAGRWPQQSSIGSSVSVLCMPMRCDAGIYWQDQGVEVEVECMQGGICFCSWPDPPFSPEKTVENTVHKTVPVDYQQLLSILRPMSLLKQPCLSLTIKMPLSLDKYLSLIFPLLKNTASDSVALQSIILTISCSLEVRLPSFIWLLSQLVTNLIPKLCNPGQ